MTWLTHWGYHNFRSWMFCARWHLRKVPRCQFGQHRKIFDFDFEVVILKPSWYQIRIWLTIDWNARIWAILRLTIWMNFLNLLAVNSKRMRLLALNRPFLHTDHLDYQIVHFVSCLERSGDICDRRVVILPLEGTCQVWKWCIWSRRFDHKSYNAVTKIGFDFCCQIW